MHLNRAISVLTLVLSSSALCTHADTAEQRAQFFHEHVEPILVGQCLECHGSDRKGELDLRSHAAAMQGGESGTVLEPGMPEQSLLFVYVSSEEMPPEKPLASEQIATLKQWISDGAYYPEKPLDLFSVTTEHRAGFDWWALQPLSGAAPPTPADLLEAWNQNPIDRFTFAKLVEKRLKLSSPAKPQTLIRRATYDLIGLPPTPEEVHAFAKACAKETGTADHVGDQAYEQLIDRLLASPRYGEHWGRHWFDVIRFGESRGFERNEIINNIWPFRDYVIRSLNEDKPFDQLTKEHLAGDVVGKGNPEVEIGAAFLVCGPYDDVGNQDVVQVAQIRANTIDEVIRATAETFLGLTVGCARCHDHKFDPISQQDYYGLYSTFNGIFHGSRTVATDEQRRDLEDKQKPLKAMQEELSKQISALNNAIFARADEKAAEYEALWTRPATNRTGVEETFTPVEARYVRLTGEAVDTNPNVTTGYHIDEFEVWTAGTSTRNIALAKNGSEAVGQGRTAKDFADAYSSKVTIDGKFGERWLAVSPRLTITFAKPETIDRVFFSSDRTGAAINHSIAAFVCDYRIEVSLDGKHWTEVANSHGRKPVNADHRRKRLIEAEITAEERQNASRLQSERAAVKAQLDALPELPNWWVGIPQQPQATIHVFLGGNPQRKGDPVVPASLTTLSKVANRYELDDETPEGKRRQALAEWIVAEENPLTPRVLANRLWHYHFGTGIVDTPSDFGYMGGRPTHPELLDWLAQQIHNESWRIKPLHKLIMTSQTYRQASDFRAEEASVDGETRMLWRFPPRRLTADEIRDTMLQVAGRLNLEMGGPGFRLYDYWQDNVATYVPRDQYGPETYRRSVYHQNARAAPVDLMSEYDSPDCAFSSPRRSATTTPLQSLTLMNHSFTIDMAHALADRVKHDDRDAAVRQTFFLLFSRSCDDEELAMASQFIDEQGFNAFCRALLNANEFVYID